MASKEHSKELLYDLRLRERHVHQGRLSDKDLEKFLKALPDLSSAAQPGNVDNDPADQAGADD